MTILDLTKGFVKNKKHKNLGKNEIRDFSTRLKTRLKTSLESSFSTRLKTRLEHFVSPVIIFNHQDQFEDQICFKMFQKGAEHIR